MSGFHPNHSCNTIFGNMKETYADEGWRTNYWHRCHVLAQIKYNQNLDWFYRLLRIIQNSSPGEKEYKSDAAINKLNDHMTVIGGHLGDSNRRSV